MSSPGLRERKKAKTRRSIQEHALRLIAEHGYEGTTVEQIAEAAEVSPSTFFRYFPTKEDVILRDDYDPILVAALLRQPAELPPIAALRAALREVFGALYAEIRDDIYRRTKLQMEVPALRARLMQGQLATFQTFADTMAARSGREPTDPEVRAFAGVFMGIAMAAIVQWLDSDGKDELPDLIDAGLALVEDGLRF
ncbi:MAG TPA: TetR family transcriptional regulator [Actinomycetes bacterium]|nr:TetR family transcriptional regulator [Actinomycetes bacterium]